MSDVHLVGCTRIGHESKVVIIEQTVHPSVDILHFKLYEYLEIVLNLLAKVGDGRAIEEVLPAEVHHIVGRSEAFRFQSLLHSLIHLGLLGFELLPTESLFTQSGPHGKHLLQSLLGLLGIGNDVERHLIVIPHQRRIAHRGSDESLFVGIFKSCEAARSQLVEHLCKEKSACPFISRNLVAHLFALIKAERGSRILTVDEAHIQRLGVRSNASRLYIVRSGFVGQRR